MASAKFRAAPKSLSQAEAKLKPRFCSFCNAVGAVGFWAPGKRPATPKMLLPANMSSGATKKGLQNRLEYKRRTVRERGRQFLTRASRERERGREGGRVETPSAARLPAVRWAAGMDPAAYSAAWNG